MTVLSAQSIRRRGIFSPFSERTRHSLSGTTYGLGPAGYDVRVAEDVWLEAGQFVLASTMEHFSMPADCLATVHDKSTLARMGMAVQCTVIEPGWRGYLTLELTNHCERRDDLDVSQHIFLHAGSPIAQIVFHLLDQPTEQPYTGRYQDQEAGPVPARFLPPPPEGQPELPLADHRSLTRVASRLEQHLDRESRRRMEHEDLRGHGEEPGRGYVDQDSGE